MSRMLLLVALAVSACACSSHKDDAAQALPQPGQSAGKVIEVAGKVTVRGNPLAVGDSLKADDIIDTGEDGRVVVELSHNLAHWELGSNKHQKVSDSIAWKLPRDEGNAKVVIQDMTSAGRPAERNAADTSVTAPGASAPAAAAPAAAAPPPAQAAPAPAPPPATKAAPPQAQPPPSPPAVEPAKKSLTRGAETTNNVSAGDAAAEKAVGAAKPGPSAADVIEAREPALRACLGPGDHVEIHVKVDASGKPATTVDGASSATVTACLQSVIAKLKLPAAKASVNVTIDKSNR